ncbi:MAG: hypothetical protein EP338_01865 [Bacteroidetes bacterium]|nr:MAG: hypothetical protein EP338_01865 [Bacteroidota bacterium]
MTGVNKHTVEFLSQGNLIHEREFGIALGRVYDNDVFHLYFFSGSFIHMEFIDEVYAFNQEIGGHAYRNLYEFEAHVDLDPEVREWAAAPDGNKKTIADALVVNNLAHKLLANFYMRFNKPVKPTRIFNKREQALKWLLQNQAN